MRTPSPVHLLPLLALSLIVCIAACEIGVRAKVDSRPSHEDMSQTVYGTTKEACTYEIDSDGIVTVTSGKCPVSDDKHSLFTEEGGCEYAITRSNKTLVEGSCYHRRYVDDGVTTDLTHGADGCDYAVARSGEITKVQGSCQGGAR